MDKQFFDATRFVMNCLAYDHNPASSCSVAAVRVLSLTSLPSYVRHGYAGTACFAAAKLLDRNSNSSNTITDIRTAAREILDHTPPSQDMKDPNNHQYLLATTDALLALATLLEDKEIAPRTQRGIENDLNRCAKKLRIKGNAASVWSRQIEAHSRLVSERAKNRILSLFSPAP